jgi:hypothetical protein
LLDAEGPQHLGELGREIDTPTLAALGRRHSPVLHGLPDVREALDQVDVGPLERRRLADPHPGPDEAQHERIVGPKVPLAGVEEPGDLLTCEEVDAVALFPLLGAGAPHDARRRALLALVAVSWGAWRAIDVEHSRLAERGKL